MSRSAEDIKTAAYVWESVQSGDEEDWADVKDSICVEPALVDALSGCKTEAEFQSVWWDTLGAYERETIAEELKRREEDEDAHDCEICLQSHELDLMEENVWTELGGGYVCQDCAETLREFTEAGQSSAEVIAQLREEKRVAQSAC